MEQHLNQIGVECSERFRFQSFDCLRRLLDGFGFPRGKISLKNHYTIYADELLMISLTRLAFPLRWSDLYERFPGRKRWFLQAAFYWFLDFMIYNWGYLLLNNMDYWKPYLAASCEAIRVNNNINYCYYYYYCNNIIITLLLLFIIIIKVKLRNLNHVNWRQYHPPADQPGGFRFRMMKTMTNLMIKKLFLLCD